MSMLHTQPFCFWTPKGPWCRCRCRSPFPEIKHAMTLCECCTTKNQNLHQKNPQLYFQTANLILPWLPWSLGRSKSVAKQDFYFQKSGASMMATNCTVAKNPKQSNRICNKHRKHKHRFTLWANVVNGETKSETQLWAGRRGGSVLLDPCLSLF